MRMKKGEWKWQNKGEKMKKFVLFLCVALNLWALPLQTLPQTMQTNIDKSRALLKKEANTDKAAQQIIALFDKVFDYELMAKLSLSKRYNTLTPAQKSEFNKAFEEQLKVSFTSKLGLYKDEEIKVTTMEKVKERMFLNSQMIINGEVKNIIFKFYDKKGDWLVYDVDILGVSIIQTYRSQFADLLDKADFNTLLDTLKATKFEKINAR